MYILAIESSCDETAAAIVKDGVEEVSSSLASSRDLHEKTGGVVPEVAARMQVESIVPVIEDTMKKSNLEVNDIDAIAVTVGPGLIGSLIVGVEAAKALSLAWNKPLIPVNHLVGHIYANFLHKPNEDKNINFPAIALVVSGGHTDLVLMKEHGHFEYLGGTVDDAAGEAFDKTARLLGIADYLGGAKLSKIAGECLENSIKGVLPRPKIKDEDYDFSFSGLKTAVRRLVETKDLPVEVVAREFEDAVVNVLVEKTARAVKEHNVETVLLGGGVAANSHLRAELQKKMDELKKELYVPPIRLCTDNAIYIASAAYFCGEKVTDYSLINPNPSLSIMD